MFRAPPLARGEGGGCGAALHDLPSTAVDLSAPFGSAGVGRTGVFITLSIVLERMRYEGVVDIFQTVKMLRTQRPAMVQTEVSGSHQPHHTVCGVPRGGRGFDSRHAPF